MIRFSVDFMPSNEIVLIFFVFILFFGFGLLLYALFSTFIARVQNVLVTCFTIIQCPTVHYKGGCVH